MRQYIGWLQHRPPLHRSERRLIDREVRKGKDGQPIAAVISVFIVWLARFAIWCAAWVVYTVLYWLIRPVYLGIRALRKKDAGAIGSGHPMA